MKKYFRQTKVFVLFCNSILYFGLCVSFYEGWFTGQGGIPNKKGDCFLSRRGCCTTRSEVLSS